jgi:hypothetical protein
MSLLRLTLAAGLALSASAAILSGATSQATAPVAGSAGLVKEAVSLLTARKLEAFAVRDASEGGRYVGMLLVPGAQLLVVSAKHGRPTDVAYYLYKKDSLNAYMDLNSSVLARERVFIEDALGDGLVARPGKSLGRDTITRDGTAQVFDGEFADPRKRNDKRMPQADYDRAFAEAEASYVRLLDLLIAELKRTGLAFPAAGLMR